MIYWHWLDRAARYYSRRTALASGATRSTFGELHDRVAGIAALLRMRSTASYTVPIPPVAMTRTIR